MNLDSDYTPAAHINLNVRGLSQSATLAINDRSAALQAKGRRIYRLGLGQSPFPVPDSVAQALRDNAHQKDYLPVKGLPALQRAVVDYYRRTQSLEYEEQGVFVGPGSKELLFLAQLTYYGDLVIPSPSWVSYAPQARILGRPLQWLPTNPATGQGVTPEALEQVCKVDPGRPRLLILNYPGNPTGTSYSVNHLQAIAEVARHYRVLLLADEIYGGLHFDGAHVSIARYYPEGTIISNGLSKWCGAGGWRLGTFVFPKSLYWLLEPMAAVASETFTSTSAPIQYAAITAFQDHPDIDAYLVKCRAILKALCTYAWQALAGAGAEVMQPTGGFYLFPNFEALRSGLERRGIRTGGKFSEKLLEDTGVACLPGLCFGRPEHELSARLACVDFDGVAALSAVQNAAEIDERFLRKYCGRVVEAVDIMANWIQW